MYIKIMYAGFLFHIYQNILYSVLSLTWVTPSFKNCLNFLKMAA